MTGLDLESFLRVLQADLWVWASLAVVVGLLGLMSWASWGSRRALRQCLVVSVVAHLGMVGAGSGPLQRLTGSIDAERAVEARRDRIREVRVQPALTDDVPRDGLGVGGGTGATAVAAWDRPGSLSDARLPELFRVRPVSGAMGRRGPLDRATLAAPAEPTVPMPSESGVRANAPQRAEVPATAESPMLAMASESADPSVPELPPDPGRGPTAAAGPALAMPGLGARLRPMAASPSRPSLPPATASLARALPSVASLPDLRSPLAPRRLPEVPEVYRPRLDPNRARQAQRVGATTASEEAVERALDWLARHQDPDGRWDAATGRDAAGNPVPGEDDFTVHCPAGDTCFGECHYWEADTALTGLSLLAYLGAGYTHKDGKRHEAVVARGLDFLLATQTSDGDLRGRSRAIGMYCHAMATLALCEAFALTGDERLKGPIERAVGFIVRSRARDGLAWRYAPGEPIGDTSILGWVVLVMKAAREVGVTVPDGLKDGAAEWLEKVSSGSQGGLGAYQPGRDPTPTMTAEAWVCRLFLGLDIAAGADAEATAYLLENSPARGGLNLYYWYYGTLAMFQKGGPEWASWNAQARDGLVRRQEMVGHAAGSWNPTECKDRFDALGGRVYCTALATLTLEVYYRYQRLDGPADDPGVRRIGGGGGGGGTLRP